MRYHRLFRRLVHHLNYEAEKILALDYRRRISNNRLGSTGLLKSNLRPIQDNRLR